VAPRSDEAGFVDILMMVLSQPDLFVSVAFVLLVFTAMVVIGVNLAVRTVARERSRREVAAYVAEGSMSADEGERLLRPRAGLRVFRGDGEGPFGLSEKEWESVKSWCAERASACGEAGCGDRGGKVG